MKKQKIKYILLASAIFFANLVFTNYALATNGGATISWTAPATNADSSTPVDLAGYKIYYSTSAIDCTSWNAANQASRQADAGTLLPSTVRNASGESTVKYTFNNTSYLTPGLTYNFAVAAYDSTGNLSNCTASAGSSVSKLVSYAADIVTSGSSNHKVDINDFTLFAADFGRTSYCGPTHVTDINQDCSVNINDFTILADDYGKSF